MTKICIDCKEEKAAEEFYKDKRRKDGLMTYCKKCQKDRSEASRAKRFPNKEEYNNYIRDRYEKSRGKATWIRGRAVRLGLPKPEIERTVEYWEAHGGQCDMCGRECGGKGRKTLFIDHCHLTLKFRGLLCIHCNTILGQAEDKASVLRAGIAYLEKTL